MIELVTVRKGGADVWWQSQANLYFTKVTMGSMGSMLNILDTRAGPQNEKWSDRQKTENPTGSIHKEARKKKFDPKKVDFDEGVCI